MKERWEQDVDPSQRWRVQGHHSGPFLPSHSYEVLPPGYVDTKYARECLSNCPTTVIYFSQGSARDCALRTHARAYNYACEMRRSGGEAKHHHLPTAAHCIKHCGVCAHLGLTRELGCCTYHAEGAER